MSIYPSITNFMKPIQIKDIVMLYWETCFTIPLCVWYKWLLNGKTKFLFFKRKSRHLHVYTTFTSRTILRASKSTLLSKKIPPVNVENSIQGRQSLIDVLFRVEKNQIEITVNYRISFHQRLTFSLRTKKNVDQCLTL